MTNDDYSFGFHKCNTTDDSQKHCDESKEPDLKDHILLDCICMTSGEGEMVGTETRVVVARRGTRELLEGWGLRDCVSFSKLRNVLLKRGNDTSKNLGG